MASGTDMAEPICLIENRPGQGLVVQEEALRVLAELTQPVVVVAITGPYRSGKSYLMNQLARQRTGFQLGSSVQGHTKGIWMWCVPHPCQPGHTLVLLDTEGLGDVEKGDTKNDTWIFVLAVLLSSTLIYNCKGTIDQQAMDNLHYVTKLAEHIKVTTNPEQGGDDLPDPAGLAPFFPTFVWAVRDFTLRLEVDGKEVSEDEYLENALKLKAGSSPEAQRYDRLRECIRQFFPERRCFVFDQPASKRDLPCLEELPDNRLDPEFQQQLEKFRSYIWEKSPPKTIPGGHKIMGKMLGTLAVSYVEAIQSGAVPCLESAVLALAEIHNAAAVQEAMASYRGLMEQMKLPTETAQELLQLHAQCEQEALRLFMERAFADDTERFQAELLRQLEAAKEEFCHRNEQASRDKCTAALQELSQDLEQRISDGFYLAPGGSQHFQGDLQALVEKYHELPGKGVKADAVLQEFLQEKESLGRSILSTDRALTERDEQIKDLQAQKEKAEQEREELRAKKEKAEQEREELQAQKEKAEQEREELRAQKEKAEQEREALQAQKEKAEQDREALQAQKEKAEQDREALQAQKEKAEQEREELRAQKEKAEQEREELQAQKEKAEQEREELQAQKEKAEQEREALWAQNERAEQEREAERRRDAENLQILQDQLLRSVKEMLRLRKKLEEEEKNKSKQEDPHTAGSWQDSNMHDDYAEGGTHRQRTVSWWKLILASIAATAAIFAALLI